MTKHVSHYSHDENPYAFYGDAEPRSFRVLVLKIIAYGIVLLLFFMNFKSPACQSLGLRGLMRDIDVERYDKVSMGGTAAGIDQLVRLISEGGGKEFEAAREFIIHITNIISLLAFIVFIALSLFDKLTKMYMYIALSLMCSVSWFGVIAAKDHVYYGIYFQCTLVCLPIAIELCSYFIRPSAK